VWTWAIQDALGSVRSEVDNNVAAQATRNFAPYLTEFGTQGTFAMPFAATGELRDPNLLLFLRNRYLNPALGVFASLDPAETRNRYAYASANPVNRVDPSGLFDWVTGITEPGDCLYCIGRDLGIQPEANPAAIRQFIDQVKVVNSWQANDVFITRASDCPSNVQDCPSATNPWLKPGAKLFLPIEYSLNGSIEAAQVGRFGQHCPCGSDVSTVTPSPTLTSTPSPTFTPSPTSPPTFTPTPVQSPTASATSLPTATLSPSPSATSLPTLTPTCTPSLTPFFSTPTNTLTPSPTLIPSITPTPQNVQVLILGGRLDASASSGFLGGLGFDINIEIQFVPWHFQPAYFGQRTVFGIAINAGPEVSTSVGAGITGGVIMGSVSSEGYGSVNPNTYFFGGSGQLLGGIEADVATYQGSSDVILYVGTGIKPAIDVGSGYAGTTGLSFFIDPGEAILRIFR
jgi:RHS repeat-associated protein